MSILQPTAVSAPGKVLLAGGYLVLDRDYTGLVFGLNARIHVHIRPLATSSGVALEEIIVKSPQFKCAIWEYGYRVTGNHGGMQINPLRSSAQENLHPNPFVETTLSYLLTYISTVSGPVVRPAQITILADDDYYSQPDNSAREFTGEHFKYFGVELSNAHKTGLGSSAALVTALAGALLAHYLPSDVLSIQSAEGRDRLHRLAQAAHCAAQGKIGSGFDVASAVYGSCVYRRFSPELLETLGSPGSSGFSNRLRALVEGTNESDEWDAVVSKEGVKLPKGLRLALCDVDCGSKTPGMVKKVLTWRSNEPDEADMLWRRLHQANQGVAKALGALVASERNAPVTQSRENYETLAAAIAMVREMIKDMSRLSDVPIEPDEQSRLLDTCSKVEGVIGGVVPGAGGYDAIALLMEDNENVVQGLNQKLDEWNSNNENKSGNIAGRVSLLKVRDDNDGIRIEDAALYKSWIVKREESLD